MEFDLRERLEVVAKDGRKVGRLLALRVGNEWKVEGLLVKVNRDVAREVGIKTGVVDSPQIVIRSSKVASIADMVKLNVNVNGLRR